MKLINNIEDEDIKNAVEFAFGEEIDFSSIGGSPFSQYPDGILQVVYEDYEPDDFKNAFTGSVYGFNTPGSFDPEGIYGPNGTTDVIRLNQLKLSRGEEHAVRRIEVAIHEALHDSVFVEAKAVEIANSLNLKEQGFDPERLKIAKNIIEELVIRASIDVVDLANEASISTATNFTTVGGLIRQYSKITSFNGLFLGVDQSALLVELLQDYTVETLSIANYDKQVSLVDNGLQLSADAGSSLLRIFEPHQWFKDLGFFTGEYGITVKDMTHHGGIKEYVNSGGISVTMPEDTRYTPRMLALYGTETVRADGTMAGGIGFGATLRMIGDWLGLDGTFGMDGGFARDGEGIDTQNGGSDGDDDGGTTPATQDAIDAAVQVAIDAALTPPDQDAPILLDLDGNGIKVTDFSRSTVFMDAGNDGLEHRTAWAGRGDGVLFYDVGNDGKIEETREYVFTEWDPTARSDFEALRARFDSNNDGKLTNADAAFGMFKVMVTMADGSQDAKTLTQLGITSIDLTGDTTHISLPDGSVITGQSTFTMGGVQMTAADVTLMAEAQGYDVRTSAVVAGSVRTTTQTAIDSDGDIAFRIVSVALADGSVTTNSYDDNGDMTFDRTQRITVEVAGNTRTETTVNKLGSWQRRTIERLCSPEEKQRGGVRIIGLSTCNHGGSRC